jgi:hypothetical protein
MSFKKFSEYFDNKKKIKSKPDNLAADLDIAKTNKDPSKVSTDNYEKTLAHKNKIPTSQPKSPEKNISKNLGYDVPKSVKASPNPYYAPAKQPSAKELENGLANVGDKDNIVNFTILNNESFIEATKDFSTKDFINKMVNEHCGCENEIAPHITSYYAGNSHPDPIQAIQYLVYVMNKNPHIVRALMHEARRKGCFGKMCKAMMKFPEFEKITNGNYSEEEDNRDEDQGDTKIDTGETDVEDIITTIEDPDNQPEEIEIKKSKKE